MQTKNLPITEVYKGMTLPQLKQILLLKLVRPYSEYNERRIQEVKDAIKYKLTTTN